MCQTDALTIARGTTSIELMESAGHSVVNEIKKRWKPFKTIVLCGPGNNDVEGFMIARLLLEACWPLRFMFKGDKNLLSGDCAKAADKWSSPFYNPSIESLANHPLVIDALFRSGITRMFTEGAL